MPATNITTLTQASFTFCGVVVGPLFGCWGAAITRSSSLGGTVGFGVGVLGAWAGWALSAAVAMQAHPSYPYGGPSEAFALLYLLPGFASGIAAIVLLRRRALHFPLVFLPPRTSAVPAPRGPFGHPGWLVAIVLVVLVFTWLERAVIAYPARRALPLCATEVHEWAFEFGMPDYTYTHLLKARLSTGDFDAYVRELGLVPLPSTAMHAPGDKWLAWDSGDEPAWFDPTDDDSATFVTSSNSAFSLAAKHERGFLYVQSRLVDDFDYDAFDDHVEQRDGASE